MLLHSQKPKTSAQTSGKNVAAPGRVAVGHSQEASELLKLQQTIGNQAVQRLLASRPDRTLVRPNSAASSQSSLFREDDDPVVLDSVTVNHPRITVPPAAGLSFSATKAPADATDVTLGLTGGEAAIASGTTIDDSTGAITVAADQTGGSAQVDAEQTITAEDGSYTTTTHSAPFSLTAVPTGISSTSASEGAGAGNYGGQFTHTFASPGGGQSALEFARVNEHFPAASGTTLNLSGEIGSLEVTGKRSI